MPPAEHFAAPPGWEWWILGYFFFGGLSGGSYAIGTLLRLAGTAADQRAARIAFIASFLALLPCPIFLIADLGQPLRFINMLFDASNGGLAFKPWSPMSLGSWALLGFGLFSFVSFLGAVADSGWHAADPIARILRGTVGAVWNVIGTGLGFFVGGYTGVLLAVSNQPVWSDGWPLGGVFLASSLTGAAALLLLLANSRRDIDAGTTVRLALADRNFALLEIVLIAVFVATVALAGTIGKMAALHDLASRRRPPLGARDRPAACTPQRPGPPRPRDLFRAKLTRPPIRRGRFGQSASTATRFPLLGESSTPKLAGLAIRRMGPHGKRSTVGNIPRARTGGPTAGRSISAARTGDDRGDRPHVGIRCRPDAEAPLSARDDGRRAHADPLLAAEDPPARPRLL